MKSAAFACSALQYSLCAVAPAAMDENFSKALDGKLTKYYYLSACGNLKDL